MPRGIGEHTKEKLRIIGLYLPVYLQATKRALERVYIDAFAGPGRNRVKTTGEIVDGSPFIALQAIAQNGTVFDKYYFIELDPDIAGELEGAIQNLSPKPAVEVICGDVNVELPKLMGRIRRRSPTFVLLDTEGIEPAWTTIEALAPWQTELLINFPLGMGIKRNTRSEKVTRYFGTEEWRQVWQGSHPGEAKGLIDLYKSRLRALGWKHPSALDRPIRTTGGQNLYYLIHVSKVEAAKSIMDWVAKQPDSTGQARMGLVFDDAEPGDPNDG
ncbi:MAG TPA: three-Cys-motif partner protein TcmP [Dehalococcoidia bacterium]|jgi:three-Cys-motif partner protein|nr:three-Cys-motif partner protein TcmP [Dehalococcoidia bacterium]